MIPIEKGYYIMRSRIPNKKYSIFKKVNNEYEYLLSFGDKRYNQFRDSTPERLYRQLDNKDPERRRLYYLRHGTTKDKTSAKYWSNKYLWS